MGSEIVNLINTGKLDMALLSISSEKPRLFEKGEEMFWDDEHISKGMLEAHLKKKFILILPVRNIPITVNQLQLLQKIMVKSAVSKPCLRNSCHANHSKNLTYITIYILQYIFLSIFDISAYN